eukprot:356443-Chlamydomonas_euryale.AAC.5
MVAARLNLACDTSCPPGALGTRPSPLPRYCLPGRNNPAHPGHRVPRCSRPATVPATCLELASMSIVTALPQHQLQPRASPPTRGAACSGVSIFTPTSTVCRGGGTGGAVFSSTPVSRPRVATTAADAAGRLASMGVPSVMNTGMHSPAALSTPAHTWRLAAAAMRGGGRTARRAASPSTPRSNLGTAVAAVGALLSAAPDPASAGGGSPALPEDWASNWTVNLRGVHRYLARVGRTAPGSSSAARPLTAAPATSASASAPRSHAPGGDDDNRGCSGASPPASFSSALP